MRTWAFYDLATGLFTGKHLMCTEDMLSRNTAEGCASIAGRYDRYTQRVDLDTGEVVSDPSLSMERDQQRMREQALAQIAELERRQLRPQRELLVDGNNEEARSRLIEIDERIATLRAQITDETETSAP